MWREFSALPQKEVLGLPSPLVRIQNHRSLVSNRKVTRSPLLSSSPEQRSRMTPFPAKPGAQPTQPQSVLCSRQRAKQGTLRPELYLRHYLRGLMQSLIPHRGWALPSSQRGAVGTAAGPHAVGPCTLAVGSQHSPSALLLSRPQQQNQSGAYEDTGARAGPRRAPSESLR